MLNDFRHAIRFLLRSPGFTLSALLLLSLGIGPNVTVFSIVNLLLFKPPAVAARGELAWITGRPDGSDPVPENLSYPELADFGTAVTAVSGVSYLPARRAQRVDPIVALRRD